MHWDGGTGEQGHQPLVPTWVPPASAGHLREAASAHDRQSGQQAAAPQWLHSGSGGCRGWAATRPCAHRSLAPHWTPALVKKNLKKVQTLLWNLLLLFCQMTVPTQMALLEARSWHKWGPFGGMLLHRCIGVEGLLGDYWSTSKPRAFLPDWRELDTFLQIFFFFCWDIWSTPARCNPPF